MSIRTLLRVFAAAVLIVLAAPSAASAALPAIDGVTPLPKPVVSAHPDIAPSVPGHITLGSSGSGTNLVTFGSFVDADIIVVTDPTSITGHAGLFDRRYYSSVFSYAIWSANVAPANGVQREPGIKFRSYERAYGVRVAGGSSYRASARNFAANQVGKPYNILATKTDLRSFYCSKLAWAAWRYTFGADLDGDGGYWVWPIDLVTSSRTYVFGFWS